MQVRQTLRVTSNERAFDVVVLRAPNGNGFLESVRAVNPDWDAIGWHTGYEFDSIDDLDYERLPYLSESDKKHFLRQAAIAWDTYWSLDNVRCATEWEDWRDSRDRTVAPLLEESKP